MLYAGMWTQISPFWVQDVEKADVAYNGAYTYDLCRRMAWLFEYADVSELDVQKVFDDMLKTDYKEYIETCHPHYVGGCSIAEFAKYILIDRLHLKLSNLKDAAPVTSAYWAGWYITMFQWIYNIPWDDMSKYCKVDVVRNEIFPAGHTTNDVHILEAFIIKLHNAGYKREFKDPTERIDELDKMARETKERVTREFESEDIKRKE